MNLFKNFSKTIDDNTLVYSPCNGTVMDITEVNDKTFASKMMGDGFAVSPNSEIVCSPCDGVLTMLFPTKHAFGVKADNGMEILVHIGIDTVNLKGKGFTAYKRKGDRVKKGATIIQFDEDVLQEFDRTVVVVITDGNGLKYEKHIRHQIVKKGESLVTKQP